MSTQTVHHTSLVFSIPIFGPKGLQAGAKDPNKGAPTKERPRFGNGRVYTPSRTVVAEQMIRSAWVRAGSIKLPDGPVELELTVCLRRPSSHLLASGALSAEGRRCPFPYGTKPDVDNALKLVMDALNKHAWRDDVSVISSHVVKRWLRKGEVSRFIVSARSLTVESLDASIIGWEIGD